MKTKLLLICACSLIRLFSAAQNSNGDISQLAEVSKEKTVEFYKNFLELDAGLYNGRIYSDYFRTISAGSPFLEEKTTASVGDVLYDGVLYKNVPMLFDIFKNKLLAVHPVSNLRYSLINEKVESFNLFGRQFINIKADSLNDLRPGFYEKFFEGGKSSSYKFYQKQGTDDLSSNIVKIKLSDNNLFFIKKGDQIKQINGKKDVLTIFDDKRKEVNHFIRKENLRFRREKGPDIKKVTEFYEGL